MWRTHRRCHLLDPPSTTSTPRPPTRHRHRHWLFTPEHQRGVDAPAVREKKRRALAAGRAPSAPAPRGGGPPLSGAATSGCVRDVAWHCNDLLASSEDDSSTFRPPLALCCAVEESTSADRRTGLLEQDAAAAEAVCEGDAVVISLGGNDLALAPTLWTLLCLAGLALCPTVLLEHVVARRGSGWAPGLGHVTDLLALRPARLALTVAGSSGATVLVAILYPPGPRVEGAPSWADATLRRAHMVWWFLAPPTPPFLD